MVSSTWDSTQHESKYPPRGVYDHLSYKPKLFKLEWEQPGYPYLAFHPTSEQLTFRGPLLNRFAFKPDRLPIVAGGPKARGLIRLDKPLVQSWMRAERNLLRVYDIFVATTGYKFIKINDDILPRSIRLDRHYEEGQENDIMKIAIEIRSKFVVLISLISFFVSFRSTMCEYEIQNVKGYGGNSKGM